MTDQNEKEDNRLFDLDFLAKDEPKSTHKKLSPYKIIIADDDVEMHTATKILLRNFTFEDRPLEFIDVYSGADAKKAVAEHADAAIIILDVVMEASNSGLQVVDYIRKELKNKNIRIILRTGQPGEAPEERIIADYDINDYRLKTELTVQRLYTSMYEALRSYRDIRTLEHHKQGLEKIIQVSADLFSQESLKLFYNCILNQLMTFRNESSVYFREQQSGIVIVEEDQALGVIIAATGKYENVVGLPLKDLPELSDLRQVILSNSFIEDSQVLPIDNGFLISRVSAEQIRSFIYIEAEALDFDIDLMHAMLGYYANAFDNFVGRILKE